MDVVPETPQAAFARFVRHAIDDARQQRGWTVADLAAHTGIGRSTVFRWLAGDWQDYPELAKVRSFCSALELPVGAAFRALGLPGAGSPPRAGRSGGRGRVAAQVDDDIRTILDRLADPAVSPAEKKDIRDALHQLAGQPLRRVG